MINKKRVKFIDLFAGLGGIRIGFEQALKDLGYSSKCVFTSEIKETAIKAYQYNFPNSVISGDIVKIKTKDIPDFDFLLAGFPCQPFSSAGNRYGFSDTRGTLFFEIQRILKEKNPKGFLLENVEGIVTHDRKSPQDKIGNTLTTILHSLENLGYIVSWNILNAKDFGVPQNRKRIYIVGNKKDKVSLDCFDEKNVILKDILENGQPIINTPFTEKLLRHYSINDLYGKSIKDKRGGTNNIHSWDIGLKGEISKQEKEVLNLILKERRKKKWAKEKNIEWMDGMPLTLKEITFSIGNDLFQRNDTINALLDNLVKKGYLKFEYPKKRVTKTTSDGKKIICREYDTSQQKGYNIVSGKLSFPISTILDPLSVAPTIVATDADKIAVIDGNGIRKLTRREGLRLFGYPEKYDLSFLEMKDIYDLLGNTVVIPVIKEVATKLIKKSLD